MSMEFSSPFEDQEDAAAAEAAEAAAAAARSRQQERLREILEDDDDDEKAEKRKKDKSEEAEEDEGFFARFKGKLPGMEVEKEEEEQEAVILPFARPAEIPEEEAYINPDTIEPTIVEPETPFGDDDELMPEPPVEKVSEEVADEAPQEDEVEAEPAAVEKVVEAEDSEEDESEDDPVIPPAAVTPSSASVVDAEPDDEPDPLIPPVPPTPPAAATSTAGSAGGGGASPVIAGARPPVPPSTGGGSPESDVDLSDFATHREVNRKATLAGIVGAAGGAWLGGRKAAKLDSAAEKRALEREEAIEERVEAHDRALAARQASLEHEQDALRLKHEKLERQRRLEEAQVNQKQQEANRTERAPRPQPLQERYSPDVHDRVPPQVAFRELTGMEQPKPRTIEQERRHEVKDDPSQVPVSYTQTDPSSPWNQSNPSGPQASRSTLMNIGGPMATPEPPAPQAAKTSLDPTIKKAAISGAVTGIIILGVLIAFALLR